MNPIQRARKSMCLTQAALAALLGVASNTVARWERGERRPPLYLIAALRDIRRQSTKKTEALRRDAKLPRKRKS
jgi:transcriptional regulator with XRE-family HTH domain